MLNEDVNGNIFNNLPIEILLEIFSYLSPEYIRSAALANKICQITAADNLFWKKKFKRHFPHIFSKFKIKNDINWYTKFREAYEDEYSNLPTPIKKLFSLIKESDIKSLNDVEISLDMLDRIDKHSKSLLVWAQQTDTQSILDYLYKAAQEYYAENSYFINTARKDSGHRTILYWAIACHQSREQIILLTLGGSKLCEEYFNLGLQPIHIAAQEGQLGLMQAFIAKNPSLPEQTDIYHQTPLLWAALKGHKDVVDYLIKKGANLNVSTYKPKYRGHGKTPLYWAIENRHATVALALIKAGAEAATALGALHLQPVHIATREGQLNVLQALIEKHPHLLEQTDDYRQTPLLWGAAIGHKDIVAYLIKKGADLNVSTHNPDDQDHGKTPLYWAIQDGHTAVALTLIKAGAEAATAIGNMQFQPVHIAARKGQLNVLQALIEKHPHLLEQTDDYRQTPLLWAAAKGHKDVVDYLIKKGAILSVSTHKPEHQDHGKTPLYWAVENGHVAVASILSKAGAADDFCRFSLFWNATNCSIKNAQPKEQESQENKSIYQSTL